MVEGLDISQFVVLGAVIVGVTELINRVRAKDYWAVVTITVAALIGGIFGAVNYYPNLDFAEGVGLGFGAVGALKSVSMFGNKTSPKENRKKVVAK